MNKEPLDEGLHGMTQNKKTKDLGSILEDIEKQKYDVVSAPPCEGPVNCCENVAFDDLLMEAENLDEAHHFHKGMKSS